MYWKWFYKENCNFPIRVVLKHSQVVSTRRKNAVYYFQILLNLFRDTQTSFRIMRIGYMYGKWYCDKLNWILIKHVEQKYLGNIDSEMYGSWQLDSTRGGIHNYEPSIFITMATYWVPDFHKINSFSNFLILTKSLVSTLKRPLKWLHTSEKLLYNDGDIRLHNCGIGQFIMRLSFFWYNVKLKVELTKTHKLTI